VVCGCYMLAGSCGIWMFSRRKELDMAVIESDPAE